MPRCPLDSPPAAPDRAAPLRVRDLGRIRFVEAEALQMQAVQEVMDGGPETLFLLEHEPVITLGRGGDPANLHVSRDFLQERGIDFVRIQRGGDITCHFPGQLVAYPVFRIERRPGGVKCFFHDLEETVIRALARFGIAAGRWEGRPGVWVNGRKIASIGIGVRRWVTFHGLALNVERDLSLFSLITLCGLPDAQPTSIHLETSGHPPSMQEVKNVLREEFQHVFAAAPLA